VKALVAWDYGPPQGLRVTEIADPTPGPDQILVRLAAAALNPADVAITSGRMREVLPLRFPYVVGMDGAGTVVEAGAKVTRFRPGDQVFGMFRTFPGASYEGATGTLAEYALAPAESRLVALRPAGLDTPPAAAIPQAGLTATTLLRAADLRPGRTVLVIGASGGVGMLAVPLAVAAGARVIATARPDDEAYVRRLGAAETIDYRSTDTIDETLRRHAGGVDVVIDLINGAQTPDEFPAAGARLRAAARAVRPGGRLVSARFGPPGKTFARDDLTVIYSILAAEPGDLAELATRVVAGTIPVEISRRYPLDQAAAGLADLVDRHTRGKLVVTIP
jgi:NADPH:quinone reductase-like Zn-dependent oxidoreductase